MRIARLCGGFDERATSGLNPNIYFVSGWQARQGHEVHVFALSKDQTGTKELNGFTLHYVRKPPLFRLFGGLALLSAVKKSGFKPDVVHGLQLVPFGWLFPLARGQVKAKYVLSMHTSINELRQGFVRGLRATLNSLEYGWLGGWLAKQVDLVLPIADFMAGELADAGVDAKKILVVRTGLDFQAFNRAAAAAAASGKAGKPRKFFALLYVGRAAQKKGLPYLIRAMTLLKDKNIRLRLVGCQKTDDDFKTLIREIDRSQVSYKTELINEVPYSMLPEIYADADAFVLPSVLEPTGKVCLEALAAGIPVIATRQGGTQEVLVDGKTALLVPPKDVEALAAAIGKLYSDPALGKRLAANGVEAAKEFDWKQVAARYSKAFEGLL